MSSGAQMDAREEMDGLVRRWREAVDRLAAHHREAEYDPNIHDQAWIDGLVDLEREHREAYDGLLSRWPQLEPELTRFKLW